MYDYGRVHPQCHLTVNFNSILPCTDFEAQVKRETWFNKTFCLFRSPPRSPLLFNSINYCNIVYDGIICYCIAACFVTRVAAAVVLVVSFLDCQLAFCSMQFVSKPRSKKLRGSHEQLSDIEYIIPRVSVSFAYISVPSYLLSL